MGIGDVYEVSAGDCTDLYYLDTGMYDVSGYGAVYLLDAERPAIVDTGIGTNHELVLEALAEVGIAPEDLEIIAPTHVHLDHAGGAGFLAEACPNAEVAVHGIGAPHLIDPSRLWKGTKRAVGDQIEHYVEPKPVPEERIREIEDGDVIDLGDHSLVVHHAPGHAPHHCVFEDPENDAVFTADAAGIYVPELDAVEPTSPPPNFDFEQCLDDVDLLESLDPEVLLFAHYGPVEDVGILDEYREVLSEWTDAVAEKRAELDDDEGAELDDDEGAELDDDEGAELDDDEGAELDDDEAVVEYFVEQALEREDLVDAWGEGKLGPETAMNVRGVLLALDRQD